ncbi:MAG: ATP-dependent DNA helicase RecG [Patescibacteria group bacterium]
MNTITLKTNLGQIRGLSKPFLSKLEKLGILTVQNLLWHFPSRYEDFTRVASIADLALGETATIQGIVKKIESRRTWRRRMTLVEAVIADSSGGIKAVWFNQPFIAKTLQIGMEANFAGKVSSREGSLYLASPSYEPAQSTGGNRHTARLVPVYPETRGLTSRGIRYLVKPILHVLGALPDFLPETVRRSAGMPELRDALRSIHFPETIEEAELARRRFAFEDLFLLQLLHAKMREALGRAKAIPILRDELTASIAMSHLPFTLTAAQSACTEQILADMAEPHPMNRLLQGDVGSGKTVVAAIAALLAVRQGYQVAFMAPTEVLARQHYRTLSDTLGKLLREWNIPLHLLVSDLEPKNKKRILTGIADGSVKLVFGTHALIEKNVSFKNLALVIIDEQHRFGVEQRSRLVGVKKENSVLPHFLSMSATPIPRTLSLALFGDLDLSVVNELPKGRRSIKTHIVPPEKRTGAYEFLRKQIAEGRQAFIICPRIEKNETGDDEKKKINTAWLDAKTVTEEYKRLSETIFPELSVQMIHGRMKGKEKDAVMRAFKAGESNILVSTSVIEVGVDVPNATVMLIEGAEHFGLAQLYQFRGRVGRGEHQSYCFLFTESESEGVQSRLKALIAAKNGFELAEHDLRLRGPGQFFGSSQTGIPDIAMQALRDPHLLQSAHTAAKATLALSPDLSAFPLLVEKMNTLHKQIHLE